MPAGRATRTLARMDEPVRLIEPPHVAGILLIPTVPRLRQAHTGWTVFAGLGLLLMGAWNLVWGFFEILNDYYFTGDTLMTGSHSLWGWLYITVGACQLLLVPLVFSRNPTGVFLAIMNANDYLQLKRQSEGLAGITAYDAVGDAVSIAEVTSSMFAASGP